MKAFLTVALAVAALAGCATSPPSGPQVASMSNDELCRAAHADPTNLTIAQFIGGRELQCHPAQETCAAAGYAYGTDEYRSCLSAVIGQMRADAEAADAYRRSLALGLAQGMQQFPANMQAWSAPVGSAGNPVYVQPQIGAPLPPPLTVYQP